MGLLQTPGKGGKWNKLGVNKLSSVENDEEMAGLVELNGGKQNRSALSDMDKENAENFSFPIASPAALKTPGRSPLMRRTPLSVINAEKRDGERSFRVIEFRIATPPLALHRGP